MYRQREGGVWFGAADYFRGLESSGVKSVWVVSDYCLDVVISLRFWREGSPLRFRKKDHFIAFREMVDASVNVPENAPLGCPGTLNENSGRALPCQGCPNQQACLTAPKGPDPDISIIREKLEGIRFRILILSGKGGVGKSTFSVNLAYALAADPDVAVSIYCVSERLAVFLTELEQVGLLDVDLSGPSIPQMCGLKKEVVHFSNSGWSTVGVSDNLSVMSIGFLLDEVDGSVIWRGDRKNGRRLEPPSN